MNAHKYDSVTIYFSDIVHFIQMVEESTPAEVRLSHGFLPKNPQLILDGYLSELLLQDV
jgi:hypothetical protein